MIKWIWTLFEYKPLATQVGLLIIFIELSSTLADSMHICSVLLNPPIDRLYLCSVNALWHNRLSCVVLGLYLNNKWKTENVDVQLYDANKLREGFQKNKKVNFPQMQPNNSSFLDIIIFNLKILCSTWYLQNMCILECAFQSLHFTVCISQ